MAKADLTADRLREFLSYDPKTGMFHWLVSRGNRAPVGKLAGNKNKTMGYIIIGLDSKNYLAHRLAWLHVHGQWPEHEIDHINGIRSDNRLENLRDVQRRVNCENRREAAPNNKSGVLGVLQKSYGYSARICHNNKVFTLGTYKTAAEAHAAYLGAKRVLHEGCTI